jgi:hypothetical protein
MSVTELSQLASAQLASAARLKRYHQLAADARREAKTKSPAQHSYLIIAEQWEELAADMDLGANSESVAK